MQNEDLPTLEEELAAGTITQEDYDMLTSGDIEEMSEEEELASMEMDKVVESKVEEAPAKRETPRKSLVGASVVLNVVDVGAYSAARLLPIENKDAYFASPPHFFGVFDGVSQCKQSRAFAQTLAKSTSAKLEPSVNGELMEQLQPALWAALGDAQKYSGCSTVSMMRLDLRQGAPQLGCYILGDSGCMVIRRDEDGALGVAEASDAKMHSSGAPYQLGGLDWKTDRIEQGLTFAYDLADGDVVICFSDGLSANLQPPEIVQVVSACAREPAAELAKRLVEAAKRKKLVDDDTTVVALRLGQGSGPTEQILTEEAPWEKFGLRLLG